MNKVFSINKLSSKLFSKVSTRLLAQVSRQKINGKRGRENKNPLPFTLYPLPNSCKSPFCKSPTVEVGEISRANCVVPRPVTRYSTYHRPKVFKLLILALTTLGVSFLTPQGAEAQSNSTSSPGVGNILNYPYGTRVHQNGVINTPDGSTISPATTINNGNGSTTYYYQNGTRVNINTNTVTPNGAVLAPGSLNGGLNRLPENPNRGLLLTPPNPNGGLNRELENPNRGFLLTPPNPNRGLNRAPENLNRRLLLTPPNPNGGLNNH